MRVAGHVFLSDVCCTACGANGCCASPGLLALLFSKWILCFMSKMWWGCLEPSVLARLDGGTTFAHCTPAFCPLYLGWLLGCIFALHRESKDDQCLHFLTTTVSGMRRWNMKSRLKWHKFSVFPWKLHKQFKVSHSRQ